MPKKFHACGAKISFSDLLEFWGSCPPQAGSEMACLEEGGLEGRETSFLNFNQNYYWYKYKTVLSYISIIAILTKNLTFLSEGGGREEEDPISKF